MAKKKAIKKFHNGDLTKDSSKILDYDSVNIKKDETEDEEGVRYTIEINDNSYFYFDKKSRNEDFDLAKSKFNKRYADGGRIKDIETEIADYRTLIADPSVPKDEKDFAEGEIKDLEKELEKLKEKPAAAAAPEKKSKAKSKPEPKPAPIPKAKAKAPKKGKTKPANEAEPTCEELELMFEERREKAKKAAKKHKTLSVSEQLGSKMASVVGKAIDDIAAKDIEKNPEKYISNLEKVEDKAKEFLTSLKGLLGEDFDSSELLAPLEEIVGKFIDEVKTKYKK